MGLLAGGGERREREPGDLDPGTVRAREAEPHGAAERAGGIGALSGEGAGEEVELSGDILMYAGLRIPDRRGDFAGQVFHLVRVEEAE